MTKFLFLTYYFPPIGSAGVQRAQKFVQYLPSEGFLPVVVTGPGAPEERSPLDRTLLDALDPGVAVYRAPAPPAALHSKWRDKLERWLGVPGAFSQWWIRSATQLAGQVADGVQLIFATMSPFESAEVARTMSRRLGIPWVADLRDPWALNEMQLYATGVHRKVEQTRMERLLSSAALVVMNTPEATQVLQEAFPRFRHKRVATITNGFSREEFSSEPLPRTDSKFRIVHSGGLHTDRGLQQQRRPFYRLLGGTVLDVDILTRSHVVLLEALERWHAQQPQIGRDLEVLLVGYASETDRACVARSSVSPLIRFTGYVPHSACLDLIRTGDLLFLPMHNLPPGQRSRIIPEKTYEYMASGRPILAAVPDGDARDFLSQCGTGLLCRPDDVSGMICILKHVYQAWKKGQSITRQNAEFVAQFERRNLTRKLAEGFRAVLAQEKDRVPALSTTSEPLESRARLGNSPQLAGEANRKTLSS